MTATAATALLKINGIFFPKKAAGYRLLHPLEQFTPGGGANCSRGWSELKGGGL